MMVFPLLVALMPNPYLPAKELDFYIGTYTSAEGSKGIYHARLNSETGEISAPTLAVAATAPSYLAIRPGSKFLYAVNEFSGGDVSSFAIQPDGSLKLLNTQNSNGGGPCHISVDAAGKHVFTASYGSGSFASHPILADGSLGPVKTHFQNAGTGPNTGRQEGPHGHAIGTDPTDRFVYACDLGTDEILVFRLDTKTGEMKLSDPRAGKVPAGGGPRHFAFGKDGRFLYCNNEMGNAITTFSVDPKTGALTAQQTLSTLLPDQKSNGTAEIEVHPNGKWLYCSNRGHDSIAVYEILPDGLLKLTEVEKAGVAEPRGFQIDPTGRWLVVAGQNSNDLTALEIDSKTGALSPGKSKVSVGTPVCVTFVRS